MHYASAFLVRREDRKGKPWVGVLKFRAPDGRWHEKRKTFSGVKFKREAQRLLVEWRERMEEQAAYPKGIETVREAVLSHLDEQRCMNQISNATYWNHVKTARWGLFPYLGDVRMDDLSPVVFQKYIIELSQKYKPSTVGTVVAILWKTCKAAFWMGEMRKDVTAGVVLPPVKERKINYLDGHGRKRLFEELNHESKFYVPVMIAFFTGMRAGEICGLRWEDVDFSENVVHVRRSTKKYKDKAGKWVIEVSATKTYKRRIVPLSGQLRETLLSWMQVHKFEFEGYVIPDRDPLLFCTSFLKWSGRHGVKGVLGKPISMHGLRHTFATMCVQAKMDVKSLSSILGHASAAMTLDVYASADEEAKKANMLLFEQMVLRECA